MKNLEIHREDGPAIVWNTGRLSWYYHGEKMTFYEWCEKTNKTEEEIEIFKLHEKLSG